ncbi:Protein of unknown function [Pyronema omphalodes CBS 100304]|uniref:Uncharacterized protein n=1 Tax=Pyronema omphalodes (strain CBS 100304) TaxID=1076935 RepID=U4LQ14_PYROM|nr:Protein of unknown function [Pyronema omphalodes CBS 100304]
MSPASEYSVPGSIYRYNRQKWLENHLLSIPLEDQQILHRSVHADHGWDPKPLQPDPTNRVNQGPERRASQLTHHKRSHSIPIEASDNRYHLVFPDQRRASESHSTPVIYENPNANLKVLRSSLHRPKPIQRNPVVREFDAPPPQSPLWGSDISDTIIEKEDFEENRYFIGALVFWED